MTYHNNNIATIEKSEKAITGTVYYNAIQCDNSDQVPRYNKSIHIRRITKV